MSRHPPNEPDEDARKPAAVAEGESVPVPSFDLWQQWAAMSRATKRQRNGDLLSNDHALIDAKVAQHMTLPNKKKRSLLDDDDDSDDDEAASPFASMLQQHGGGNLWGTPSMARHASALPIIPLQRYGHSNGSADERHCRLPPPHLAANRNMDTDSPPPPPSVASLANHHDNNHVSQCQAKNRIALFLRKQSEVAAARNESNHQSKPLPKRISPSPPTVPSTGKLPPHTAAAAACTSLTIETADDTACGSVTTEYTFNDNSNDTSNHPIIHGSRRSSATSLFD